MNLAAAFDTCVSAHPDKVAVYWGHEDTWPYNALARFSRMCSQNILASASHSKGDRVAVWFKNRPEFIGCLYGIFNCDGVAVPINAFLKADEVAYILRDCGVKILFTDSSMEPMLSELRKQLPHLICLDVDDLKVPDPKTDTETPVCGGGLKDLAVIIYTSGTTGHPKGAMLSHGNLLHNIESCRKVLEANPEDRFALLLPMFHSFMLCVCIFLPMTIGSSIVLIRSLHPPKNIVQEIVQHKATLLPAIPQLFRALAAQPPGFKLPLRLCVSGAAPLPGEILKEFTEKMEMPLLEGYGLSEASPVVSLNPIKGPWKAGSIGKAIPDVEVCFQDEEGRVLPTGEIGELCVRGGNVMIGYWNRPEETSNTIKNNWLLTGDIGYGDSDGYYYITDRKKDMLLVNGINVYPREIEEILYQYPGVMEAAVVGRKDARKGEAPIAFLVPTQEDVVFNAKEVLGFLRQHLADYKVPKEIVQLKSLPRNATGKILKTELRKHSSVSSPV